ncbi:MAG: RICIN domain-containing protein [Chitinophagaceae bacterium]|nr:RICIN domain-containing protein [Chitinophagaceae bacterium]
MKKQKLICLFLLLACMSYSHVFSQQHYAVTDSFPVTQNGLTMGYTIKNEEEKEVGNKGNFSRYSIKFFITNTSGVAKIMLYKEGWNILGNASDQLVHFTCLNATGARFTPKSATLNAAPCNVIALVDDKDTNGKIVRNKRFVQIGSWIKAGQTFSTNAVMIVPLNEKPKMELVYLANLLQPMASAGYADNQYGSTKQAPLFNPNRFVKIKSSWKNTFLNNQYGPLSCSNIDNEWWSAQWQLIPVQGTNYYLIKNRWKENYISTEVPNNILSSNSQSQASMWMLEPIMNSNQYRIRNVANGTYLNILSGDVQATNVSSESISTSWLIEP